MIDSFTDFGQFSSDDSATSKKPYSPYAKFLDECRLGNDDTITLKTYKPFDTVDWTWTTTATTNTPSYDYDKTYTLHNRINWLGSGNDTSDQYCFPGNIYRSIYFLENLLGIKAWVDSLAAPSPIHGVQAEQPVLEDP